MEIVTVQNKTKKGNVIGAGGRMVLDPNIPEEMQRVILEDESLKALSSATAVIDRDGDSPEEAPFEIKSMHGIKEAGHTDGGQAVEVVGIAEDN